MVLGLMKFLRGEQAPVTLDDYKKVNNWSPKFSKEEIKACNTNNPRFVIANSSDKRGVVYTDSLATCIGVLLFENSKRKSVAGLAHVMPRETHLVSKMFQEIIRYNPPELKAVLAVGDDPDPKTFQNVVKFLVKEQKIPRESIEVVYGSHGTPYFETQSGRGSVSSKIAYDTHRKEIHIGKSD